MKQLFMLFLLWAGLTVMVFVVSNITFSASRYNDFIERGVRVDAIVEKKEPLNHQNITYSYIVDGHQYTGIGPTDYGNPSFEDIKIGQKIFAYYDPTDPKKSVAGDPKLYGNNNNQGGICFLTIFAPFLIIFGLYKRGWI